MLKGIGATELIIILVILLLLFGATKLPQVGQAFGKAIRGFQSAVKGEDGDEKKPRAAKGKSKKA